MRHDESQKLDVRKAADLLLANIYRSKREHDPVLLARMPQEQAERLTREHSEMVAAFRRHAKSICAARGINAPYVVDRSRDLETKDVFEKALYKHLLASDYLDKQVQGKQAVIDILGVGYLYQNIVNLSAGSGVSVVEMKQTDDSVTHVLWPVVAPACMAPDVRYTLLKGHPGDLRDLQGDLVQKWGALYHELGHALFPTAWTVKKDEIFWLGQDAVCLPQEPYDAANEEMMADMTAMAFMSQHAGNTAAAKDLVAVRLLSGLRRKGEEYWNAPRLLAFLPKLAGAEKRDDAGVLALLEKEFKTCLWTKESFEQNLKVQQAAKDGVEAGNVSSGTYEASALLHIHDCVEALCQLYRFEPAQMGIRPAFPAIPALRPQI